MASTSSEVKHPGLGIDNGRYFIGTQRYMIKNRTTQNTPDYFARKRLGLPLPENNYSVRERLWSYPTGSFRDFDPVSGKRKGYWEGLIVDSIASAYIGSIPIYSPSANETQSLESKVVNSILNNVKNSRLNLAQALGERQQTVKLVTTTINRIATAFRDIRRGRFPYVSRSLPVTVSQAQIRRYHKAFARDPYIAAGNLWLELQYGWKPLLQDVYGAMATFEQPLIDIPVGLVKAKATEKFEKTIKQPGTYISSTTIARFKNKRTYGLAYALNDKEGSILTRSAAQLGLTNPALLAWELLPYSFVVDWFWPIGNYLSALDATFGTKFLRGYRTDKWVLHSERVSLGTGMSGGSATTKTNGYSSDSYHEEWFARYRLTSFPSPRLPSLKNPLSVQHAANALALLTTTFFKR